VCFPGFFLAALVGAVLAAGPAHGAASVTVGNVSAAPGEAFSVPVSVASASNIVGYYFRVAYDAALLDYTGAAAGALTAAWGAPTANPQPGRVTLASGGLPVNAPGALAVLQFTVKPSAPAGQNTALRFEACDLNDGGIPCTAQDGAVSLLGVANISLPAYREVDPGESFAVPVRFDGGGGVYGYYVQVDYDENYVTAVSVEKGALLDAQWDIPLANLQPGRLMVTGSGTTPVTAAGDLLILWFEARLDAPPGQTTQLALSGDLNDGALPITSLGGDVRIRNVNALPLGLFTAAALVLCLCGLAARLLRRRAG